MAPLTRSHASLVSSHTSVRIPHAALLHIYSPAPTVCVSSSSRDPQSIPFPSLGIPCFVLLTFYSTMPPLLFFFLLVSDASLISAASSSSPPPPAHTCSSPPHPHQPCPPFPSPPTTFPFSVSPGCNHPSFLIHCSSPHSHLLINSIPFLILNLSLSPSSLILSLPSSLSLPINLSSSPFHLASNPSDLHHHANADFTLGWDLTHDPYNASCSSCRRTTDGVCGFNDSSLSKPFLCFPSLSHLEQQQQRQHRSSSTKLLVLVTTLFVSVCVFLALVSVYAANAIRRRWGRLSWNGGGGGGGDLMPVFFSRNQIYPPVYTYDQLRSSTDGFDPRRKIGDGGFGSVYLAHLDGGRLAAVKRLHRHHPSATTKSFCNEIMILSSLKHPNLVRLHGYCFDPRGLLLVYDYVPNGTLADHLHGSRSLYRKASLTWPVRVDVALQIASALEYLHFFMKPPVVHRDVTSTNIFVEKDMRIKVGDFGLSRLLSVCETDSDEYVCCTGPQGTPGYLDPEYHRSFRFTEKSDVYSFGVVLLELVTGMKAVDLRRDKREVSLAEFVVSKIQLGALRQVVDPLLLRDEEVMGTVEAVAELAFRCLAGEKDDRPNARELVEELRRIRGQMHDASSKGA